MKNKIINIFKDKTNLLIVFISVLALIIGTISVGFIKAFIVVLLIDCIIIIPGIFKKGKVKMRSKTKSSKKSVKVKSYNSKDYKKKTKTKKRKIFKIILMALLVMFILSIVAGIIFISIIVSEAPKFDPKNLERSETTIVYDKNGNAFAKLGSEKREKITYEEMPEVLINAIIATEDSRYFQHNGFDLPRFLKATLLHVAGSDGGGASTLTMQVVKNNYTSTVSSGFEGIKRKFTDIYMAIFKVEKKYTKQQILEFYINSNYLGSGSYGVEQAARTYFGKNAKDLNLAEAAMIAGLFQAPDSLDPFKHPEAAEKRRKTVLNLMQRHGYITKKEKEEALKIPIEKLLTTKTQEENKYSAFLDTVVDQVKEETGNNPYTSSMEIYTTLDPEKQEHIDKIMSGEIFEWENDVVTAGIMVLDVSDGSIAAVGAGRNRTGASVFNTATMINNQIGSTAKPLYDYAMGIEKQNWSGAKLFGDEPYAYSNGVTVNNWDGNFKGTMTLREALAQSRNIPALKAFQANEKEDIRNFVTSIGLSPNEDLFESHALGAYNGESPLTMAAAYSVFSNGGYYVKPYSFKKIVYRATDEVYEPEREKTQVLSEETAYIMTSLLQSSAQYGLGRYNYINGAVYGAKTGTTNFTEQTKAANGLPYDAINDLWVNSISPDYAISLWYGYDHIDPQYVSRLNSGQHMRLFQTIAKGIYKTGSNWTKPSGVVEVAIERETEPVKLPSAYTPSDMITTELFKVGSEPTEVSTRFEQLPNVSNISAKDNNGKVTISWDPVSTPDGINSDKIRETFKQIYTNNGYLEGAINNRINYNNSNIGNVSYQVYRKDNSGNLSLLGSTDTTSYTDNYPKNGNNTYVVKTAYSIFKANMSNGTEVKVQAKQADLITFDLSDKATTELKIGEKYTEPSNPVVVLNNGVIDTSKKATIKSKTIKRSSDNKVVTEIATDKAETYTITYNVSYGNTTDTITKKIIIK